MQYLTPEQYIKIDIANSFGMDTLTWNGRLDWFQNQEKNGFDINEAKEPAMALAGLNAYEDMSQGKPIGYPISLDSTASGIQWLSVLTHDENGAMISNVIDSGKRIDSYTYLYEEMKSIGSIGHITRDDTKHGIMTSLYGSVLLPEIVFGNSLDLFHAVMEVQLPNAWALNKALLELWDPLAIEHNWTMPDGFEVHIPVMVAKNIPFSFRGTNYEFTKYVQDSKPKGRSLSANLTHSIDSLAVREVVRRCSYDPKIIRRSMEVLAGMNSYYGTKEETILAERLASLYQETGMLSVRVLQVLNKHSIKFFDEKELLELMKSLPKKPFRVLTIHDAFRALPKYGNDLREQYKNVITQVAESNFLDYFMRTVLDASVNINNRITSKIGCDYAIT